MDRFFKVSKKATEINVTRVKSSKHRISSTSMPPYSSRPLDSNGLDEDGIREFRGLGAGRVNPEVDEFLNKLWDES